MPLTAAQLQAELANIVDVSFATAIIENFRQMQQRFYAGDWQPTELDSGRLVEAIARAIYQLDSGTVTHSQLPGDLCEKIEDDRNLRQHQLDPKARRHISRALMLVYKFRSDRGSVHISPEYTANEMDAVFMLHAAKWLLAEFLRLAWNKDRKVIAETIAEIIQLEHSLIHEVDGTPLILDASVSAPEEVLLLLNHAEGHRLQREELSRQAKNNSTSATNTALSRLTKSNEIRTTAYPGELLLTPKGQKRVIESIIPKYKP
ncbi:MAG: hypothetical protein IT163_10165 [Bryobacterales bacterium]|nr:hypothetical protein [Bryobacterales bacterium]